jgi:tetraacyldisaccharide 4'-kinase
MLARARLGAPVLVARERYLAGRTAEAQFGCTVHLLDDGFQHLQLGRDLDLLVVSRADLDERVLPSGRLREPLDAASAASALLVTGSHDDAVALGQRLGVRTTFRIVGRYGSARRVEPFGALLPSSVGRRAMAVAGIARPERFFAALKDEGWDVVAERRFRDHHWYTDGDLRSIQRAAQQVKADVVMTTEKDAVRLTLIAGTDPPWAYLPLQVGIEPEDGFVAWMREGLSAARRRRGVTAA